MPGALTYERCLSARDDKEFKQMMYDDFNRGFSSIATVIAVALWFGAASSVVAEDLVTPASPKGEFGNECAMGLASGQEVKTDCSVSWSAPDGKVYCFSTEKSKEAFLQNPDGNIQKAREFFVAKDQSAQVAPPASQPATSAARGPSKEFTEDDVNAAVKRRWMSEAKTGSSYSIIPS